MKIVTKSEKYTRSIPRMAVVGGGVGVGAHYGGRALANATGQTWMGHVLVPVVAAFSAVALTELALWYFSDAGQDAAIRLSDAYQEAREAAKDETQRKAMMQQLKAEGYNEAQVGMFMYALTNDKVTAKDVAEIASSNGDTADVKALSGDIKKLNATLKDMAGMFRQAMEQDAAASGLHVAASN